MGKKIVFSFLTIVLIGISLVLLRTFQATLSGHGEIALPAPTNNPTLIAFSTLQSQQAILRSRWLSKNPCSPPCWEEILPGTTTFSQAINLLNDNGLIKNVASFEYENRDFGEINWDWKDYGEGGRLFYELDGEIIYAALPGLGCCFELGDVIASLGVPTHMWVRELDPIDISDSNPYFSYRAICLSQGFAMRGTPRNGSSQIDSEFSLHTLVIFEPGLPGYIKYEGDYGGYLPEWQGYADQSVYLIE